VIQDVREHAGRELRANVCVVGAGPAGITLARELASRSKRVVLAEGGGMVYEGESQELYAGENSGERYPIQTTRQRYFGGTSNHWEGYCTPLGGLDFQSRSWVPRSGWPIDEHTLLPLWRRAHEILDLGSFEYSPASVQAATEYLDFDPTRLTTRLWRHSPPTRFGTKYREEIEGSKAITCLTHANLLEIISSRDGGRVERLVFGDGDAEPVRVRAEVFVIACGGLENPRLLLHAPDRMHRAMGPAADMLGRCFMEHVHIGTAARIYPRGDWWRAYERFTHEGVGITTGIGLSESVQAEERLQNLCAMIRPMTSPPGVREGTTCLTMHVVGEQAPDLESRVSLGDDRDRVGMRRLRLHWKLGEADRRTVERGAITLARELGRMRLGRVRIGVATTKGKFPEGNWPASHHMGTTRMAVDPSQGVVDEHCCVHGVENLYVAGSSVFPTGGYANPTLTLVALALRLGDALVERL
jgi:choline dehydrogenase-like flavoprotein